MTSRRLHRNNLWVAINTPTLGSQCSGKGHISDGTLIYVIECSSATKPHQLVIRIYQCHAVQVARDSKTYSSNVCFLHIHLIYTNNSAQMYWCSTDTTEHCPYFHHIITSPVSSRMLGNLFILLMWQKILAILTSTNLIVNVRKMKQVNVGIQANIRGWID